MARLDLAGYLDDDSIEVPGITSTKHHAGKTYRFASPDAKTGLRLAALADLGVKAHQGVDVGVAASRLELDDDQELDLMRDVLGSTLDEMVSDGVSWVRIQRLNQYLFIHFAMGEQVAKKGLDAQGEAVPPNRAAKRAASKATVRKTHTRASTAATPALRAAPKAG
jgi:hypothetical protein